MTKPGTDIGPIDAGFWQKRWRTGETGWDQGGPHPLLAAALAELGSHRKLTSGTKFLEPGAGRAHNGAELARRGFAVTSFDLTTEAVSEARKKYADVPGLTLTTGDALTVNEEWRGAFDVVFDRAMLCALPPGSRRAYVEACWTHLAPGGHLSSILFTNVVHADGRLGPPFQVTMTDLAHLVAARFTLLGVEEHVLKVDNDRVKREAVVVLKRRDRPLVESSP